MAEHIGIVGSGRMAQAMGALLHANGLPISAMAGRTIQAARFALAFVKSGEAVSIEELPKSSPDILVAVSDDSIAQVARQLAVSDRPPRTVLHTSGSAGPEALAELRARGASVGVLHPLQTVPNPARGVKALPGATFGCAGDPEAVALAMQLVSVMGGKPLLVPSQNWQCYHAAAVMASNYQVTLIDCALELMQQAGIPRPEALRAFAPLVRETMANVLGSGPEAALTGPIRRGDAGTIQRHMQALRDVSELTRSLYAAAGLRTLSLAVGAGLGPGAACLVEEALRT